MTDINFPTETGTSAKYGEWDILMWMSGTPFGQSFVMGYDDSGNIFLVDTIDGPYAQDEWTQLIQAAGGMGAYIVSKLPVIRAMLAKYFDTRPHFPAITNATPYTLDRFNIVLREYVAIQPVAGQTHPTANIVPYVPPT